MDGVERVHYPDILVTTHQGKQLWEVKPRSNAVEPEVLAIFGMPMSELMDAMKRTLPPPAAFMRSTTA
jgi:hypothetical protein